MLGTPPPRDWRAFATEESLRQGVDPELVHRVIDRESKWNPTAISLKGAEGMMQLMPATARSLGVQNPFDPEENIRAGIRYLKTRLDARKGDVRMALADYNAGPANVDKFKGVPPFKETQAYVSALDQPPSVELTDDVELVEDDVEVVGSGFDQSVATAAQKAERITPGYSPGVEFLRTLPAAAGSMLSTASKAGGPAAAVIGSALGAAGAGLGEAVTVGAEHLASRTGLSNVPPPPWDAAVERVTDAALLGAGGELAGRAMGAVGSKLLAPFAKSVDATGKEVQRMFPDALPHQVADSRFLDVITPVAEAGILSGGRIAARKASLSNQAQQEAFKIIHQYGGPITPEAAGKVFQEALEGRTAAFKSHAAKLYADVDNVAQGVKVPLTSLKEFAEEELGKRAGVPGEVSGNRGMKMLQQVARAGKGEEDEALQAYADSLGVTPKEFATDPKFATLRSQVGISDVPMAEEMTFQQAQTFRSDLLSFIRRAKAEKDDVARGVAQQLVKRLDTAMDTAAAAAPGVGEAYKKANAFYRAGKQKYESELLRGLGEMYPEEIASAVVKPGATTPIREARVAIGPKAWKAVQARTADDILTHATKDEVLRGDRLLEKLRGMSKETLREVYPDDEGRALWALGRVLERAQRKAPASAKIGVWIAQSGAIVSALSGNFPTTSGAVLLTPSILSLVLTSPRTAKWLTTGLEAPPGSKLAMQAGRKVLEQLALSAAGGRPTGEATPPPGPQPSHATPPPKP